MNNIYNDAIAQELKYITPIIKTPALLESTGLFIQ